MPTANSALALDETKIALLTTSDPEAIRELKLGRTIGDSDDDTFQVHEVHANGDELLDLAAGGVGDFSSR